MAKLDRKDSGGCCAHGSIEKQTCLRIEPC